MTSTRQARYDALTPPYDLAKPPPGARLVLGDVAIAHGVTVTSMATAAGISRTAIADLINNRWPVKSDAASIRSSLEQLLAQAGAGPDELARLWHASASKRYAGDAPAPAVRRPRAPVPLNPQPPEEEDVLSLKEVLTPRARQHFRLFANPFDGPVTRDEQMFNGDTVRYVRETAWQCAQTASFVAIVGESGAGKTTILEDLEARLLDDPRGTVVIKPSVVGMDVRDRRALVRSGDILHAIVHRLDAGATVAQTVQGRTNQARRMLTAGVHAGNQYLLVIEEAHSLPDTTLTHLKRLHELRDGRRPLMGILLLGQPELKRRLQDGLRDGTLREVAQRCEVVELLPLDAELKAYLACRAKACNVELGKLVEDEAIEQLRMRLTRKTDRGPVSLCYPLAVANMVARAMNRAADLGVPLVTADVVRAL